MLTAETRVQSADQRAKDQEMQMVGRLIRMLWSKNAFTATIDEGGDRSPCRSASSAMQVGEPKSRCDFSGTGIAKTVLIGYTDRYRYNKDSVDRNMVGTALNGNVLSCFAQVEYPPKDGESFASFEPAQEFRLSPASMERVQAAMAGNFPEYMAVPDVSDYGGRVEYYMRGESSALVEIYLQFFPYGERTAVAEVNWKTCGAQTPEWAAAFAAMMTRACGDAARLNKSFQEVLAQEPGDEKSNALLAKLTSRIREEITTYPWLGQWTLVERNVSLRKHLEGTGKRMEETLAPLAE